MKCSLCLLQRQLEELSSLVQDCGLGEEAPPQPSKQRTFSTSAVLSSSLEPALDTEPGPANPVTGHAAATEGEPRLASGAQVDSKLRAKEEGVQKLSPLKVSTKYCAIQYLSTCINGQFGRQSSCSPMKTFADKCL